MFGFKDQNNEMSERSRVKLTNFFSGLQSSQTLPTIALLLSVNVFYAWISLVHFMLNDTLLVRLLHFAWENSKYWEPDNKIKNNVDLKHKSKMKDTFE